MTPTVATTLLYCKRQVKGRFVLLTASVNMERHQHDEREVIFT